MSERCAQGTGFINSPDTVANENLLSEKEVGPNAGRWNKACEDMTRKDKTDMTQDTERKVGEPKQ